MKERQCEREVNFIETFGIVGLLAFLTGVAQGYLGGFLGEHRAARWAVRALSGTFALAAAALAVYTAIPVFWPIQKKTDMGAAVAQAAEEAPDVQEKEEKTEYLIQTLLEKMPEALPETAGSEEGTDPLDDSVMEPSDTYVEKGGTAVFQAYHPKAQAYQWEIYDAGTEGWEKAPQETVTEQMDELKRDISSLELAADQERQIRCQISIEGGTPVSYEAGLHILSGQISSISVDEFRADAGAYAPAKNIPVEITYQDGTQEQVTGLTGLYFLEQESESTVSGDMKETITTTRTAREYHFIDAGSKEGILLYRKSNGDSVDIPVSLTGIDQTAPQIMEYSISDFEVSNVDKAIPVTVTIKAEDDVTPLRHLTYAFLPAGEEPKEEDWTEDSVFQADITKNGIWAAYCRDEAGNIATQEQEVIAVDNKAPTIRLTLDKEEWCQENRIFVSAEDNLSVEYRYLCEETGEDSGWILESSKKVTENGNWKIQVRDAVGNTAEKEITVDNIDTRAPVIRSITEKSEGEIIRNEE